MSEEQKAAEQRRGVGIAQAVDPRRVLDPALERMVSAQVAARVQAQQATTVFLATVVSLVTSAFGFVAALAWNDAVQTIIHDRVAVQNSAVGPGTAKLIYALIVTFIAVLVVFAIRRIASRITGRDLTTEAEHFSGA